MNKLDKIIAILNKQYISIQMIQKDSRFYSCGFKRALDMLKKLNEEIEEDVKMEDKKIICVSCEQEFIFTKEKQELFKEKQFPAPKRCYNCRVAKRQRFGKE